MVAITTTSNSGEVKDSLGIGLGVDDRNRWLQFLVRLVSHCLLKSIQDVFSHPE